MNYHNLISKVETHIRQQLGNTTLSNQHPYHNLQHTQKVVAAAHEIANHYQLNEHDYFVVTAAAWFHDTGYYVDNGEAHEAKGAELAAIFLKEEAVDTTTISEIKNCILATEIPQRPNTLPEQIVCDADLYHLGTDDFSDADKLIRKEYEIHTNKEMGKKEWRNKVIQFLQSHHYHTDYCQLLLNEKKQQHLDKLLKKQQEKNEPALAAIKDSSNNPIADQKENTKEKKVEKPVRGIETMFRVASTNHQRLSDMADSKANIMISVNSIIISVVLSLLVRKLETATNLVAPTLILLLGTVTAVIFSILATRPNIPNGYFNQEQLNSRKINLLFFGNFYKMDFDHYYDGMQQVMSDSEFLYASLIRDIHSQGVVLGNKYKLLRISYTVFMFTLIISIIAFGIAITFFG
jgi:HD superfamily phosphodiesterase